MRFPKGRVFSSALVGSKALLSSDCMRGFLRGRPIAGRGGFDQSFGGQARAGQFVDKAALAEDQGAVADGGDLFEIGGHHQAGPDPSSSALFSKRIDLRLGAHIHARGRVFANQQLAVSGQPAANHHLLLIAARQRLDREAGIVRRQAKFSADLLGTLRLGAGRQKIKDRPADAARG